LSDASLRGERALVTGASGFIGSRLLDRLLEDGVEVDALSRSERASTDIRWRTGDVCDAERVAEVVRDAKPDTIFHLASHVSGSRALDAVLPTLQANLLSTVNVLLAAAEVGCRRVVLAGSLEEPDGDSGEPVPVSPYAAAKFAAGAYGRMFSSLYDLPVATLRIFMVYGPGQWDETKLVPYVITSLLRDDPPRLSSGSRPVDWVYVDDVVDALVAAAGADGAAGATADVGSGVLTPVRKVVEAIADLIPSAAAPEFGAFPDRPNERIRVADLERARSLLGWTPSTPLEQGLAATVEWYTCRMAVA
jgi:UDP-glucose 4-epimerase